MGVLIRNVDFQGFTPAFLCVFFSFFQPIKMSFNDLIDLFEMILLFNRSYRTYFVIRFRMSKLYDIKGYYACVYVY